MDINGRRGFPKIARAAGLGWWVMCSTWTRSSFPRSNAMRWMDVDSEGQEKVVAGAGVGLSRRSACK